MSAKNIYGQADHFVKEMKDGETYNEGSVLSGK
jgi:hypothetical protein